MLFTVANVIGLVLIRDRRFQESNRFLSNVNYSISTIELQIESFGVFQEILIGMSLTPTNRSDREYERLIELCGIESQEFARYWKNIHCRKSKIPTESQP